MEDCVDFVVSLDIKSGWSWLWRVVPSCMAPPRQLDQAVAEIQMLKARVQDVSQRNTRYNLINDSAAVLDDLDQQLQPQPPTTSNILHDVWAAAGEGHWTRGLKHLIISEGTDLQVISLWVTTSITEGGGRASAAHHHEAAYVINKAYDDPEIRREFKARAWVKLMHPFDPDEFLESLLTQLYCNSHHPNVGWVKT